MKSSYGWQTIGAIFGIVFGVGAAVAAHFNGLSESKKYTDEQLQVYKTELTPILKDVQIRVQRMEVDTAVIKDRITKKSPNDDTLAAHRD